jgi:D-alanyl-D-alanine carboxypeptidase
MSSEPRARFGAVARAVLVALLAVVGLAAPAEAHHHRHFYYGGSPTEPDKDAALIEDGASGKVLYARNADALRHPASLTKMMTLYLLFDALKDGRVTMTTQLPVSAHAAAQKPTNLHLSAGDTIPVELAIKAIVVRSANDVAVAIGESLGGTESHFAEMMTAKAKDIGMHSTYYHNASGLPDPLQITTATDLAVLARHLAYDYPQYFHFFSTPSFWFRGRTYPTHDNLIGRYDGADGIKTGYTGMSGFNLVSSVVRGGAHVVGVVMGGRTAHQRDRAMVALLDNAFTQIGQNPALVARAQVPWQSTTLALNSSPIQINAAGTLLPSSPSSPPGALASTTTAPQTGPTIAMLAAEATAPSDADDEDAAESKTNEGNLGLAPQSTIASPAVRTQAPSVVPMAIEAPPLVQTWPSFRSPPPMPRTVAEIIKPRQKPGQFVETPFDFRHHATVVAAIAPSQKPAAFVAPTSGLQSKQAVPALLATPSGAPQPKSAVVASIAPTVSLRARPVVRPAPQAVNEIGEGDIGDERESVTESAAHGWVIQIGAFPTQILARAQLAAYAEKSMDVLGQASRVVAPMQSVDGHTVYRARFGPFAEREAREVCARLTQRGQTCFASVAAR